MSNNHYDSESKSVSMKAIFMITAIIIIGTLIIADFRYGSGIFFPAIGARCMQDCECGRNATCVRRRCSCRFGYVPQPNRLACRRQSCSLDADCRAHFGPHTECDLVNGGICICIRRSFVQFDATLQACSADYCIFDSDCKSISGIHYHHHLHDNHDHDNENVCFRGECHTKLAVTEIEATEAIIAAYNMPNSNNDKFDWARNIAKPFFDSYSGLAFMLVGSTLTFIFIVSWCTIMWYHNRHRRLSQSSIITARSLNDIDDVDDHDHDDYDDNRGRLRVGERTSLRSGQSQAGDYRRSTIAADVDVEATLALVLNQQQSSSANVWPILCQQTNGNIQTQLVTTTERQTGAIIPNVETMIIERDNSISSLPTYDEVMMMSRVHAGGVDYVASNSLSQNQLNKMEKTQK